MMHIQEYKYIDMMKTIEYLRQEHGIRPTGILHIGASEAQEAPYYVENGIEDVIWIEAIPHIFDSLCKRIAEFPRMKAINACITDKDGVELQLNVSSNDAQSSSIFQLGTHQDTHPDIHFTHSITCTTSRVDTLLHTRNIDIRNYDFLVIDIQGAELLALEGIGEEIHKINYVYLEVNRDYVYVNCALITDVDYYMNSKGFERRELAWWEDNCGWGEAFYVSRHWTP